MYKLLRPDLAESCLQPRQYHVVVKSRKVELASRRVQRADTKGGEAGLIIDVFLVVSCAPHLKIDELTLIATQ